MREVKLYINSAPIPQKRHRHNGNKTYDPLAGVKKAYKNVIQVQMNQFLEHSEHMLCGPIHVTINFFMPLPNSKSSRKTKGLYHIQKPDIDNLLKFILDTMSGVVYADDAYIFKIESTKFYSTQPRTEIILREVLQEEIDWNKYE